MIAAAEAAKTLYPPLPIQALFKGCKLSLSMCVKELRYRSGREREREKFAAMANSAVLKLAYTVVLVCLLVTAPQADATVTCSQVTQLLSPCVDYLIYGGTIPSACCAGVRQVKADSKTGEARRTACSCIQDGAAMIPGIDYNLVSSLPSECGVSLAYEIGPSTDCSRIN